MTEYEAEEAFDQFLDDVYGTVTVAGFEYDTSLALKNLDPGAYRTSFSDWLDSEGIELE